MKRTRIFALITSLLIGMVFAYIKINVATDSNESNFFAAISENDQSSVNEKNPDQFYNRPKTPAAAYAPEKAIFSKKNNSLFVKNQISGQTETQIYNEHDEKNDIDADENTHALSSSLMPTPPLNEEEATAEISGPLLNNQSEKKKDAPETFVIPTFLKKPAVTKSSIKEEESITSNSSSGGSASSSSTPLACNSDITSGTFNHPVAINLSCNVSSTIKYCLAEGSCCDPVTNGVTYTSAIAVGQTTGNFCLSFYGSSENAGISESLQQLYQFNLTLPDLQVAHTKQFYQTTELPDLSYISSNDFGKDGFEIGQVNLKDHDPGISGENLDCEEIVTANSSLTSPDALITQIFMDVSGLDPSMQVEIPLHPTQLHYNYNYVTSYIVDNNSTPSLYSCSTTLVQLADFDYFASDDISGDAGTNQIREFTAGFTPYGFFEEEANTYRGPAGVSSSNVANQQLETGLIEIFF